MTGKDKKGKNMIDDKDKNSVETSECGPISVTHNETSIDSNTSSKNPASPIDNFRKKAQNTVKTIRDFDLKPAIKTRVEDTNHFLASLEKKYNNTSTAIMSRVRPIVDKSMLYAEKTIELYKQRQMYGSQIIGGSALTIGLLVGLRRGRVPGFAWAGLTGTVTYLGVYGIDDTDVGKNVIQKLHGVYDHRQEYGSEIIAGSSFSAGLFMARRGIIPALLFGGLAGTGTYIFVYGLDKFKQIPGDMQNQFDGIFKK